MLALHVKRKPQHPEELSNQVRHVHHRGLPFHKRECPESCLVEGLVAESGAFCRVPLYPALLVEFSFDGGIVIAGGCGLKPGCNPSPGPWVTPCWPISPPPGW
jgi:hypothetical protein